MQKGRPRTHVSEGFLSRVSLGGVPFWVRENTKINTDNKNSGSLTSFLLSNRAAETITPKHPKTLKPTPIALNPRHLKPERHPSKANLQRDLHGTLLKPRNPKPKPQDHFATAPFRGPRRSSILGLHILVPKLHVFQALGRSWVSGFTVWGLGA